jgi:hypothetical protein
VNTGDKPTAENQGSGQVVNSNIEKSESNTYDSRDKDISRSSNFVQEGNWIYFGIHSGNDTGWNIYRQSLNGKDNKSLLASKTRGFCISGSLIFYVDFLTGGIYKINKDGTGKTNVLENGAGRFIVSKDWIYYNNINEHGRIYKVSMDGTKRIKITEDESWNFDVTHGDWIYYTKNEGSNDKYQMFRIGMDGREKSQISNKKAYNLMVLNDWIYYTDIMNTRIYKMRIDGSDEMLLNKEDTGQIEIFGASDDWIYYYTFGDSGLSKTYKIKTDGTDKILIGQPYEVLDNINLGVSGDWIYARSYLYKYDTYKLDIKGAYNYEKIKIGSLRMMNAVSMDGWVYYINLDDNCSLYRIREDGTFDEKLHNGVVKDFKIDGGMIYFNILNSNSDENGIYRLSPDSRNSRKICSVEGGVFDVDNNFIYYCPYSAKEIYKIGIDGSNKEKIADKGSENITVTGDWVYYVDSNNIITRIKTDGTKETKLAATITSLHPLSIAEDWIYFVNTNFEICKVKTDGTTTEKVFKPASGAVDIYGVKNGWIYYTVKADKEFENNLYKVFAADPKEIPISDTSINWANCVEGFIYYGETKVKESIKLMKTDGTESRIIK